jgi:HCOMODA/2-hydroxy-3-carboxy-muconic semialdehyde decarboxylase
MTIPASAQKGTASAGPLDPALVEDLVAANRILVNEGVLDAQGHVSVRHNQNPNRYVISRSLAPELVTAADLMEYDLDNNPIDLQGRSQYLERFIHGEIYKIRPDVQAVVHTHGPSLVAFSLSNVPLRPVHPGAGFIVDSIPAFDLNELGVTDMLIEDGPRGRALAEKLGKKPAVLIKAHGAAVVGPSIPHVVGRTIWLEMNAKLQAQAISLGGTVRYLTPEEAQKTLDPPLRENNGYARPWELWKQKAMGR